MDAASDIAVMQSARDRRRRRLALGFAFLCCLAIAAGSFVTTFRLPFFLDDLAAIELLHPHGPLDWDRALKTVWPTDRAFAYHDHFRPVGWATIVLQDALFGFDPLPFRAVAVLLHAIAGFLVLLASVRLRDDGGPPRTRDFLPAAFFLLYPASCEPVIWTAHRFTLLAAVFFLGALLCALRFARTGRGWPGMAVLVLLALGSKDSMIAEAWALVPAVFLAAAPQDRLKRTGAAAAIVAAGVGLLLAARMATLGVLLPSYEGGADVAASFDLLAILRSLPETLLTFLAPVTAAGPGGRASRILFLFGAGALLVLGFRRRKEDSRAWTIAALTLAALLLAGLPTLKVAADLDGSRRFYLPAAALALAFGAATRGFGRCVLLAAVIAAGFTLHANQKHWHEAGARLDELTSRAAAGAREGSERLVAFTGAVPATLGGVPFLGAAGEHFPLYFREPLRTSPVRPRIVPPAEALRMLAGAAEPVDLLVVREDGSAAEIRALPLAAAARDGEFSIIIPQPGARWPTAGTPQAPGDRIVIVVPDAAVFDEPMIFGLEAAGRRGDFVFVPRTLPGFETHVDTSADGARHVIASFPLLSLEHTLLPVPDVSSWKELATGGGTAAMATLRGAGLTSSRLTTPAVSFTLGGGGP